MKKFILSILLILLISIPGFAQYGQVGGGISGITLDGNTIVFGSPADSVIFEIPVSAEASFTFETLIGTVFKIFNAGKDTIIINPNGFSSSNSAVAGTAVFNYKSRGGHSVIIDSLSAYVSVMNSPTANAGLMQLGTSADADRFKVDEDGDVTNDGNITAGGAISGTTITGTGKISTIVTTKQFELGYDATNLFDITLLDDGHTTFTTVDPDGAEADINFTPDGFVGVFTAAPTVEFDVTGDIKASGTVSATSYGSDGSVTDAELLRINTVSSNVQDQIDAIGVSGWTDHAASTSTTTPSDSVIIGDRTVKDNVAPIFRISLDGDSDAAVADRSLVIKGMQHTNPNSASWDFIINSGAGNNTFNFTTSATLKLSPGTAAIIGPNADDILDLDAAVWQTNSVGIKLDPVAGGTGTNQLGDDGDNDLTKVVGDFETTAYNRMATTIFQDCFDYYVAAQDYADHWDVSSLNVTGAGSNELTTASSHITLTTDGAGANETEGTKSIQAFVRRSEEPRSEFHVELGQTATTNYYCGWNTQATNTVAADDKFVLVVYEVGQANWQLWVDDGAGADIDKFVSAIAVTTGSFRFDIWSATDGTISFSINGAVQTTGLSELMQADDHYLIVGQLQTTDGTAVNAAIDYIEMEKVKQ